MTSIMSSIPNVPHDYAYESNTAGPRAGGGDRMSIVSTVHTPVADRWRSDKLGSDPVLVRVSSSWTFTHTASWPPARALHYRCEAIRVSTLIVSLCSSDIAVSRKFTGLPFYTHCKMKLFIAFKMHSNKHFNSSIQMKLNIMLSYTVFCCS